MTPLEDAEKVFCTTLHAVVVHLIKNAVKVPKPLLAAAREHELYEWAGLPMEDRIARVKEIAVLTVEPSFIHQHFEAFPHSYGKKQYAKYISALKVYQGFLPS